MSPRPRGRTAPCDRDAARVRLRHAESFLAVADLVLAQPDDTEMAPTSVAASLAVLAGIAAADAACCAALHRRARGQSHVEAVGLVRSVASVGEQMARDLDRLLTLKDGAQYGVLTVSRETAASSVAWARRLAAGAASVVAGTGS